MPLERNQMVLQRLNNLLQLQLQFNVAEHGMLFHQLVEGEHVLYKNKDHIMWSLFLLYGNFFDSGFYRLISAEIVSYHQV
jgi:hypothetical protein